MLNHSSNEESKFAIKRWYVVDSQTAKDKYNQKGSIKFKTENIKSSLCDYSDAYIIVTGDITVNAGNDTHVAFKNCAPFSTCKIEINHVFIDEANHSYIAMPMYNLNTVVIIQIHQEAYRRPVNHVNLGIDNGTFNSQLFKYKAALVRKTADVNNGNGFVKNTKIVVPIKYLSNFWRLLEMPLIKCKVHLELNWIEDCILCSAGGSANFKITDAKLHVLIVTLSTKNNVNLAKQLSDGFKRSVYWNNYQAILPKVINKRTNIYESFSASF